MKTHILCFGDSNTHGYCADPADNADHGVRFNEDERWTCLLQKALGDAYLVIEEGLSGRTTVFDDPLHEGLSGVEVINSVLRSHDPVDLLVIMLGTNDTKVRFSVSASSIAIGMERLIRKAQDVLRHCDGGGKGKILIVAPPAIGDGMLQSDVRYEMGLESPEKSRQLAHYYKITAEANGCAFFDANGVAEFNQIDCMHLTAKGHRQLATALAELIPSLLA